MDQFIKGKMKIENLAAYRCPITNSELSLSNEVIVDGRIKEGVLTAENGNVYPIENFIPDFTWPKELAEIDQETREMYENLAKEYDKFADIPFQTFKQSNEEVREKITAKLNLQPDFKVLEIGGGDGRGAEYIMKYLGENGQLYFQELSQSFLNQAIFDCKCKLPVIPRQLF